MHGIASAVLYGDRKRERRPSPPAGRPLSMRVEESALEPPLLAQSARDGSTRTYCCAVPQRRAPLGICVFPLPAFVGDRLFRCGRQRCGAAIGGQGGVVDDQNAVFDGAE